MDTPTSYSSVLGTCEIIPPIWVDGSQNPKSGNICPFRGIDLLRQRIHITSLPGLYKDIGVDALTASYFFPWIYKTQSHSFVNVGGICFFSKELKKAFIGYNLQCAGHLVVIFNQGQIV